MSKEQFMENKIPIIFRDYFIIKNMLEINVNLKTSNPFGSLLNEKGNGIYFSLEEDIKFGAILEFKKGFGKRGNHFHKIKEEYFYIITGVLFITIWFPEDEKNKFSIYANANNLMILKPGLAHSIEAIENSLVFEFSPNIFNIEDTFYPKQE